jgi:hypothetical protein
MMVRMIIVELVERRTAIFGRMIAIVLYCLDKSFLSHANVDYVRV